MMVVPLYFSKPALGFAKRAPPALRNAQPCSEGFRGSPENRMWGELAERSGESQMHLKEWKIEKLEC